MATIGGPDTFGLWQDADLRSGTNDMWSLGEYKPSGGPQNDPYIEVTGGGGSGYQTNEIEVDTSESYQQVIYVKTISPGSSGNNPGGHIGFSCYDKDHNFIDLRNCGDIGNTTLSRDATPGDSSIFITSPADWYQGPDVTSNRSIFRQIIFFPPTHPEYNIPHQYSKLNNRYYSSLTQTSSGDWEMVLENGTLPDYGYPLPEGTPISRGAAGGTYNYALGAPIYPNTWTEYSTPVFTGESRNSGIPFRYGTKYIRFLILRNYRRRRESPQDHVWGISKFFFGQVLDGKSYSFNF